MADIKWVGSHIEVAPPKRPKKITGTRFATLLGLNPWSTPFEIWCEITKTYQKPFEDTIYTIAGKTIEPKQADYMVNCYGMDNLVRPSDIWGEDYFKKTYGDFFKTIEVFGGMWDYVLYENGRPTTVLEMKTSKRVEDWEEDIPEYYALQAALYAHLLGVDEVIMVASFLEPSDYEHPEDFVPSAKNTITRRFLVSERYPDFERKVAQNLLWWQNHVETGISPDFDEKRDAEILKALRTNTVEADTDESAVLTEADQLQAEIDEAKDRIAQKEKRQEQLKKQIKEIAMSKFREGDTRVSVSGKRYIWEIAKSESVRIDEAAMEADGVLEKYKTKVSTSFRLTAKEII